MASTLIHAFVLLVLLPAWLLVGLGDWWCHRRTRIEDTAGPRESALHLALAGEAAVAVLPALFFEINALILVVIVVAFVAHELTTTLDFHIATPARSITPLEMRLHDYLTAIPFASMLLIFATHTEQALAIFGAGSENADWGLRWKSPQLPLSYLVVWLLAAGCLNITPFLEEFLRCLRVSYAKKE